MATRAGVDSDNPYPGLQAFGERDQAYFYGRSGEREELFRLIRREVLTILFGRSGLGKTSLLQAGLFPRLRLADVLPVSIRLDFTSREVDLVSQVRAAFGVALRGQDIDASPPGAETLWEYFHKTQFWSSRNRLLTPLLVFDQLEEIFTVGRRDPALDSLITELADLIENLIPVSVRERIARTQEELAFPYERQRVRVVFSLREDFLPQLEGLRPRIPSLARNRFRLLHLGGHQALEAILKPGGELVSESVAEEILKVVAGASRENRASEPGAAPAPTENLEEMEVEPALLSLFCRELNNRRQARNLAAITTDLVQGTHKEILSAFYEQCLVDMARPVRVFIEEQLLTDSGLFRQSMPLEEALAGQGVKEGDLDKLIDRRLLRLEERFGRPQVEVIHDVMTRVIRQSRDRRRARVARRRQIRRLAVVAVSLLALVLALVAFLVRERSLKKAAEDQSAMAEAQKVKAQEYRAKAEEMVKYMLVELRDQLKARGDLDAIRAATKKALEYLSGVERSEHSDLLRSEALTTLGDISLGDHKTADAEENYRQALVIARGLYESNRGNPDLQAFLALRLEDMGTISRSRGDYTGAHDNYSKALSLWEQLALKGSEIGSFKQKYSQAAFAVATLNFAALLHSHEKISKVLEMYNHALGIFEAVAAKNEKETGFKVSLAEAYRLQGTLLFDHGDIQGALQAYHKALDLDERLVHDIPADVERKSGLVSSLLGLGDVELFAGQGAQALIRAKSAAMLVQPYVAQETLTTGWSTSLALAEARQGDAHLGRGDPRMALARYRECLTVLERVAAHASDQLYFAYFLSWSHLHIGDAHDRLGNAELAHREWEKAIESISPQLKADASENLDVYARALLDLGRLDEARLVCRRLHDREWDYRSLQSLCRAKALLP